MGVWIERFAFTVLAGALVSLVLGNLAKFDTLQRVTLGVAIVALSIFAARTFSRIRQPANAHLEQQPTAPQEPDRRAQQQVTGSSNAAVYGSNNNSVITGNGNAVHRDHPNTPTVIQTGRNNISQIGKVNTATINAVPPSRIPSDKQIASFKATLKQAERQIHIQLLPAGSSDDVEPIVQRLGDALDDLNWPHLTAGYVGFGGGPVASAEGIECYSPFWDDPSAQIIAKAMERAGLACKQISGQPPRNGGIGVTVLIGRQPR